MRSFLEQKNSVKNLAIGCTVLLVVALLRTNICLQRKTIIFPSTVAGIHVHWSSPTLSSAIHPRPVIVSRHIQTTSSRKRPGVWNILTMTTSGISSNSQPLTAEKILLLEIKSCEWKTSVTVVSSPQETVWKYQKIRSKPPQNPAIMIESGPNNRSNTQLTGSTLRKQCPHLPRLLTLCPRSLPPRSRPSSYKLRFMGLLGDASNGPTKKRPSEDLPSHRSFLNPPQKKMGFLFTARYQRRSGGSLSIQLQLSFFEVCNVGCEL